MATTQVINLSHLTGAKRIDPEFYQPDYLLARDRVLLLPTKTIAQMAARVVSFGAYSLCNYIVWREAGIPYLKAENILDGYINYSEAMFIDEDVHAILSKSEVHEGQVLFSMSGTTGNAAVAYKIPAKLNASQDVAKITLRQGYSPFYVAAFLNSKYGRMQTQREIVGSVQQHVFLWQIKNFVVPIVPKDIENRVEALQREGLDQLSASNAFYSQAENLLLKELGLKDFQPKYELSYTDSLSKALGVHRVDAEYFQPAYDEIVNHLSTNFVTEKLKDIVSLLKHGKQPYYVEGGEIPILIQKHLGSQYVNLDALNDQDTPRTDRKFIEKYPEYKVQSGDVLFYSVGAYLGRTNVLLTKIDAVPASFITLIRTKKNICSPMFLAVFLNSKVGQLQSGQRKSASAQQYIYPKDIGEFIIPILPDKTQQEIASLVQRSYEAREKAEELLEEAKNKVENLIEGKA
jgi:restriction endonuclease S subunit